MKSLDYLAGLFDGEGSFSIQVSLRQYGGRCSAYFNPSMSVNLYYGQEVLQAFVDAFGGKVYPYRREGVARGARWHLGRVSDVLVAARALEPLLNIKQKIARNFIHALTLFPPAKGVNKLKRERAWTPEIAVDVARIALELNPPRSRKSDKTLEYLGVLEKMLKA